MTVLLFLPKVNVIGMDVYEGAGIRIDDFVIATFSLVLGAVALFRKKVSLSRVEVIAAATVAFGLLSYAINLPFERGSALYPLRFLEYWAFYYVGMLYSGRRSFGLVLIGLLLTQSAAIFLQAAGVLGGYSGGQYIADARLPTGLTGGSYEAPMVIALILLYLLGARIVSPILLLATAAGGVTGMLLTAARIPTAAMFTAALWELVRRTFGRALRPFIVGGVLVASGLLLTKSLASSDYEAESLRGRLQSLLSVETVDAVGIVVALAPESPRHASGVELASVQETLRTDEVGAEFRDAIGNDADLSLSVRAGKWLWAIKTLENQPWYVYIAGIGPGTAGNALDGGWLRLMFEQGLLGVLAFSLLLLMAPGVRSGGPLVPVVIAFVIANVFIDYHLSYKVMSLMLIMYGVEVTAHRRRSPGSKTPSPGALSLDLSDTRSEAT
jgi:hypothetical protein